jgi:hypothetical protein
VVHIRSRRVPAWAATRFFRTIIHGTIVAAGCAVFVATSTSPGRSHESFRLAGFVRPTETDAPPGQGPNSGGPVGSHHRGTGLSAESDHYTFTSRGYAVLAVFRNDSYPQGTNASWYQPSYGSLQLIDCDSGETCFYYQPSDGDRPPRDEFQYTLVSPQGYTSTARVSIDMP